MRFFDPREGFSIKGFASTYELVRPINSGSATTIWEARDSVHGTFTVAKILDEACPIYFEHGPFLRPYFFQEAHVLASLFHCGIVDIRDFGFIDGRTPFFILERLRGIPLNEFIKMRKPISNAQFVLSLAIRLCEIMSMIHEKGIIYADLKPENLFIRPPFLPSFLTLLDFGLIRFSDPSLNKIQFMPSGQPAYAAPEALMREPVDFRTDIFGIGVVMYEAMCGSSVFASSQVEYRKVFPHIRPYSFRQRRVTVLEELEDAIMRCLEPDPNDRFQTVEELKQALEEIGDNYLVPKVPYPGK